MSEAKKLAVVVDNTRSRQNINKENALALAKIGVAVFPSNGKVPLIPLYNRLDTEIAPEDRDAAIEKYREEHDATPVHIGATKDPEVVKRMFRAFRDAVPSIATGPSGLVVIDADAKDDGPAKMTALFEENGGLPAGAVASPTKSGGKHFIFADPKRIFSNRAGLIKKNYGSDVRGAGGQIVAPGSMLDDGRSYGTRDDLVRFLRAFVNKSLPAFPEYVVSLIGAASDHSDEVVPSKEREVIETLRAADLSEHESDFDPAIGKYDLDALKAENAEFKALYDNPSEDCSTNRFLAARHVMREWPDMPAPALSIFFGQWEGAGAYTDEKPKSGEYDDRQIAREWLKNQGLSKHSTGEAFGPVLDEDEQPAGKSGERFIYIENIRGAVLRMLDWRIKHFVARGTTSVATGMWGAGKTAVFSDIGLHVGHGFEWRGRKVTKGVVVYVALENSEDVERRVATWCEIMERAGRNISGGAFVIYRGPCRLFDPSGKPTRDEKDLIEVANTAAAHYGLPVAMIVIDTLAQSIMPGNDNDSKDAGIFTAAMQRIVAATGANVTALAHPVKSGEGVRGSGALQANVDTVIEVSRDGAGRGTIKAGSKFRIGNPAKVKFGYRLQSHVTGRDEDGDDIDVVLAVEDRSATDLAVTDIDDDAPTLQQSDRREDRVQAVVAALEAAARQHKAADESPAVARQRTELQSGEIWRAVNADRKGCGLDVLPRSTVQTYIAAAVDAGLIAAGGTAGRPVYRLPD